MPPPTSSQKKADSAYEPLGGVLSIDIPQAGARVLFFSASIYPAWPAQSFERSRTRLVCPSFRDMNDL